MTSVKNVTRDFDSSSSPLKSPLSIQQDVTSCLNDLFRSPSQGIEKAFGLILESLASQKEEFDKLASEHAKLKESKDFLEERLKALQDSNLLMVEEMKESNKRENGLEKEVLDLKKDMKKLNVVVEGFEVLGLKGLVKDFIALKEEVSVMAFNLQLDIGTDDTVTNVDENTNDTAILHLRQDSESVEESESVKSESVKSENVKSESVKSESVEEPENVEEPEIIPESEKVCDERGDIEAATVDLTENKMADAEVSIQSEPTNIKSSVNDNASNLDTIEALPSGEMDNSGKVPLKRRIASRKFEVHETLAARLKRLEVDKEKLKQDISDIRKSMRQIGSLESLIEVRERILTLEMFLEGFGGDQVPLQEGPPQFFDADSMMMTEDFTDIASTENTVESNSASHQCEVGSPEESDHVAKTNLAVDLKYDNDSIREKDAATSEDANSNNLARNLAANSGGSSSFNERSPFFGVHVGRRPSTTSSIGKRQGLFFHLADQEVRLQDMIAHVSSRLAILEDLCNSRVSRKSLEAFVAENCENSSGTSSFKEIVQDVELLRDSIEKLTGDVDTKVSKDMLRKELETYLFQSSSSGASLTGDEKTFQANVQRQLQFLNDDKVGKDMLDTVVSSSEVEMSKKLQESMVGYEEKIGESVSALHLSLNECKESIRAIESKSYPFGDIDERIKNVANVMQSNLQEFISSRLQGLKHVEDEMEKVASQLADKPDQDQINKMLQDFEEVVLKHAGADDVAKDIIQTMKTELKQRMTKEQVLGLVKNLLKGAKEDITNGSSMMIGYRCIGCNEYHPHGINRSLATKVNHNKLPNGRGLSPGIFPYCRSASGSNLMKGKSLAPVNIRGRPSNFIRSAGRPRTSSSFGLRRPRSRPPRQPTANSILIRK